jgi:NAD(P)-dependent dehydrogenase (short-subunit alcohol dehydrogenase family)
MISSVTAYNPPLPIGMYAVSKTALLGLVKGLAAELGPLHGIRVNGVAPGIVPTRLSAYLVQNPELVGSGFQVKDCRLQLKNLGTARDATYVAGGKLNDISRFGNDTCLRVVRRSIVSSSCVPPRCRQSSKRRPRA